MKSTWRKDIPDCEAQNWCRSKRCSWALGEYCKNLEAEETLPEWENQLIDADRFILEYV